MIRVSRLRAGTAVPVGGLLFLGVATWVSQIAALRYTLVVLGLLQWCSLLVARRMTARAREFIENWEVESYRSKQL